MSSQGELTEVPAIDLLPSVEGGEAGRDKVAAEIRRACEEVGFFSIVGHGVPDAVVAALREEAMLFFALVVATVCESPARNNDRLVDSAQQIADVGILDEMVEAELDHVPLPRCVEQVDFRQRS